MASGLYNRWKYNVMKKLVDMSADTVKVMLLANTYTFSAAHNVITDVNSNELPSSGGYTIGGVAIGSPTLTQLDSPDNCGVFDGADVSWVAATFTSRYAILALTSGSANNSLVGCIDFGSDKSVSTGTFTIQWSANGIIRHS